MTVSPEKIAEMLADMEFYKEDGHVGDCVRASTATLLGVNRAEVPHFVRDHGGGWRGPWEDWLEARGFAVVEVDPRARPHCRYLACGPTERSTGEATAAHMVVMEWLGLYHDPHWSRSGLLTIDRVYVLSPIAITTLRSQLSGITEETSSGDAEVDRILNLSDDEVLAEAVARGEAPAEIAAQTRAMFIPAMAAAAVVAERRRQVKAEGWTPEHDDAHDRGELASAAACYAVGRLLLIGSNALPDRGRTRDLWPWDRKWWKPSDRRRNLVKAGALILAEIERLDRLTAKKGTK